MNQLGPDIINGFRLAATLVVALSIATAARAHHGGGTFDNTKTIELIGTLTRLELIADLPYNPDTCKEQAFIDYSKAAQNQK